MLGVPENKIDNESLTVKQYRTLSRSYDRRFKTYINAVTDKVLTSAYIRNDDRILDLGCGTGEMLFKLVQEYSCIKELAGIDLSEDMLKLARAKLDSFEAVSLSKGTIEKLEYPDNHFDLVISSGVLHYVKNVKGMASEVFRILKPDGLFLLIDMNQGSLTTKISLALRRMTDPATVRYYSRQSASDLLTSQGFTIGLVELFKAGNFGLFLVEAMKSTSSKY
jgi:ubiquinone/menaquinone biosynthesis C-methylase UbiE